MGLRVGEEYISITCIRHQEKEPRQAFISVADELQKSMKFPEQTCRTKNLAEQILMSYFGLTLLKQTGLRLP